MGGVWIVTRHCGVEKTMVYRVRMDKQPVLENNEHPWNFCLSVPTLPYGYRAGRKLDQGLISGVITSSSRFSGRIWRLHFGSTER